MGSLKKHKHVKILLKNPWIFFRNEMDRRTQTPELTKSCCSESTPDISLKSRPVTLYEWVNNFPLMYSLERIMFPVIFHAERDLTDRLITNTAPLITVFSMC